MLREEGIYSGGPVYRNDITLPINQEPLKQKPLLNVSEKEPVKEPTKKIIESYDLEEYKRLEIVRDILMIRNAKGVIEVKMKLLKKKIDKIK
jgi:hypothetical protein